MTKKYLQPTKTPYPHMTAQEYTAAMAHFGVPEPIFSEMVGVCLRQARRYREGASGIPDPVAKLIRTALRHELEPEDIE